MTRAQRTAEHDVERVIARLEELAPALRARALEADRAARLSDDVVRTLLDLQLWRVWIPRRYGGWELDLPAALRIYAAAARADGSVGWSVMIGAGGGLLAAHLAPAAAAAIFGRADALVAGSGSPDGRAERLAGGYRASGRWRYASGAQHATVFTANCVITSGGVPVEGPGGRPLVRAMAFDRADVAILPTWSASGMRGTGSHDFEVRDVLVPEERSFSVVDPPLEPGALYRLPFGVLTELPIAAVALGIARHALDAFAALARRKQAAGSAATLAEDPSVQVCYARGEACWSFVAAGLEALAARAWRAVQSGAALSSAELAATTAGCALAVAELLTAVGDVARFAGMTATLDDDELARAVRDLQTLAAHAAVAPRQFASAGRGLLATAAADGAAVLRGRSPR